MRVLELYSGIGGMHCALRESGVEATIVAAADINTVANEVYQHNFRNVRLMNRNIQSITVKEINKMNVDTILMSPPCQPFTRVGLKQDVLDARTLSFFHILKLIPQIQTLKYILVENVKGFENSETRNKLIKCISDSGFRHKELILSPCQFGIPNSRSRYYMLAKKSHFQFCFDNSELEFHIPQKLLKILLTNTQALIKGYNEDSLRKEKCFSLENILENIDDRQYLIPSEALQKRSWVLDVRYSDSTGSCCFTKAYGHYLEGTGSVFCPLSSELFKTKYAEAEEKGIHSTEALEILKTLQLRFFTPKEVCRLMCFPETFTFPKHITNKQRYRLLGNSINVYVVSKLIHLLNLEETIA